MIRPLYVFDEKRHAKYLLHARGFWIPTQEDLNFLAQWYFSEIGDSPKVTDMLFKLLRKCLKEKTPNWKDDWVDKIKIAIIHGRTYKFLENQPISFSRSEMDRIVSTKSTTQGNCLFVMCCVAKHETMKKRQLKATRFHGYIYKYGIDLCEKLSHEKWANIQNLVKARLLYRISERVFEMRWLGKDNDIELEFVCDFDLIEHLKLYRRLRAL